MAVNGMLFYIVLYGTIALIPAAQAYRLFGVAYVRPWEVLLIPCALLWAGKLALTKTVNCSICMTDVAVLAYLAANVTSSIRIPDHAGQFMEGGLWYNARTCEAVLLYFMTRDGIAERSRIEGLLRVIVLVVLSESILGVVQALGQVRWPAPTGDWIVEGFPRGYLYYLFGVSTPETNPAYGTFGHFTAFGFYLGVHVILLISVLWTGVRIRRCPSIIALTLAGTALVLTYSRAAILSASIAFVVMYLVSAQSILKRILSVAIALMIAGLIAYQVTAQEYGDTLNLVPRMELWSKTWQIIVSKPIRLLVGTGSGTYVYWTQYESRGHYYTPHNAYLMTWLETGIVGVVSILGVLGATFYGARMHYRYNKRGVEGAICLAMIGIVPYILIHSTFEVSFVDLSTKAMMLVLLACGTSMAKQSAPATDTASLRS